MAAMHYNFMTIIRNFDAGLLESERKIKVKFRPQKAYNGYFKLKLEIFLNLASINTLKVSMFVLFGAAVKKQW